MNDVFFAIVRSWSPKGDFRRRDIDPAPGRLEALATGEIAIGLRPDERLSIRRPLTP